MAVRVKVRRIDDGCKATGEVSKGGKSSKTPPNLSGHDGVSKNVVGIVKDAGLYTNTVIRAVNMIRSTGADVKYMERENGGAVDIAIRIEKMHG